MQVNEERKCCSYGQNQRTDRSPKGEARFDPGSEGRYGKSLSSQANMTQDMANKSSIHREEYSSYPGQGRHRRGFSTRQVLVRLLQSPHARGATLCVLLCKRYNSQQHSRGNTKAQPITLFVVGNFLGPLPRAAKVKSTGTTEYRHRNRPREL